MRMQRAPTTDMLAAKHRLQYRLERASDWATELLIVGRDTRHVRRIAGYTGNENPFEVEEAFDKALRELGFTLPSRGKAVLDYAQELAREFFNRSICRKLFLEQLSQHCATNGYPRELCPFSNLRGAPQDIDEGYETHEYPGATGTNFDELLQMEIDKLLTVLSGNSTPPA